jgi:Holliday junction resolvase RusA-like endonuclease
VITIEVRGLPAPQGSKRHVGGGRMIEMSKAVGPWREAVRAETQRAMKEHDGPLAGPLRLAVTFGLPRPRGHYRTGKYAGLLLDSAPSWPGGRPDLDKLLRALLDGLTAGGAWTDDAQVAYLTAEKAYGQPGCLVVIEELEER